jgi:hypothetical protein
VDHTAIDCVMEGQTWAASAALALASAVSCEEDAPPSVLPGPCDPTLVGTAARAGWLDVPEAAEDPSTRPGCAKASSGLLADFEHTFPIFCDVVMFQSECACGYVCVFPKSGEFYCWMRSNF